MWNERNNKKIKLQKTGRKLYERLVTLIRIYHV